MKQYFSQLRQQLTFDKIMQIINVKNMRKIWDVNLEFKFDNCVLQINLPWNISLFFSCHFSNYLVISKLVYRAKIAFRGYTFKNVRIKGNTTIMNGYRKIKSKQSREVQNKYEKCEGETHDTCTLNKLTTYLYDFLSLSHTFVLNNIKLLSTSISVNSHQ